MGWSGRRPWQPSRTPAGERTARGTIASYRRRCRLYHQTLRAPRRRRGALRVSDTGGKDGGPFRGPPYQLEGEPQSRAQPPEVFGVLVGLLNGVGGARNPRVVEGRARPHVPGDEVEGDVGREAVRHAHGRFRP